MNLPEDWIKREPVAPPEKWATGFRDGVLFAVCAVVFITTFVFGCVVTFRHFYP